MHTTSPSDGPQNEITLRDIFVHIKGLDLRMDSFGKKMEKVAEDIREMKKDIVEIKGEIRTIKVNINFMKSGIQNLDERLDTIELIPSILSHIKARKA